MGRAEELFQRRTDNPAGHKFRLFTDTKKQAKSLHMPDAHPIVGMVALDQSTVDDPGASHLFLDAVIGLLQLF